MRVNLLYAPWRWLGNTLGGQICSIRTLPSGAWHGLIIPLPPLPPLTSQACALANPAAGDPAKPQMTLRRGLLQATAGTN